MESKTTSIENSSPALLKFCPQLEGILNDKEGFYASVRIRLKIFNLQGRYSPEDVIHECLIRWYKAVESGKSIPVLDGWMRLTSLNIVRELRRKSDKDNLYEPNILAELVAEIPSSEDDEQWSLVRRALQALPEKNQELLELRFFRNLSWDEVAIFYGNRGEMVSAVAARKRGERALKDLRRVFLEMLRA